jgi:hypothetical protein
MENRGSRVCTICGETRSGGRRWFLISEDRWQDKLRILHWEERLATRTGMHGACSPTHLQQLVIHWMTTGSLDHPFARVGSASSNRLEARRPEWNAAFDFDAEAYKPIGELSVHRESMRRVLHESPQSLQSVLDALLSALQREAPRPEPKVDWNDEAVIRAASREV